MLPSPATRRRASPSRRAGEVGQAAVELVALLPCVVLLMALGWQFALAGHAVWAAHAAARAAARAHAVGGDAAVAARSRLPGSLERELRVRSTGDDAVEVRVRVPAVAAAVRLGHVTASARFEPQR
jgi:pilus assembly protein CpaE